MSVIDLWDQNSITHLSNPVQDQEQSLSLPNRREEQWHHLEVDVSTSVISIRFFHIETEDIYLFTYCGSLETGHSLCRFFGWCRLCIFRPCWPEIGLSRSWTGRWLMSDWMYLWLTDSNLIGIGTGQCLMRMRSHRYGWWKMRGKFWLRKIHLIKETCALHCRNSYLQSFCLESSWWK